MTAPYGQPGPLMIAALRAAEALADAANVRCWEAEGVARALGVPVERVVGAVSVEPVVCSVPECTLHGSRPGGHHHHDAVSRKPSPLACRCAHPSAR